MPNQVLRNVLRSACLGVGAFVLLGCGDEGRDSTTSSMRRDAEVSEHADAQPEDVNTREQPQNDSGAQVNESKLDSGDVGNEAGNDRDVGGDDEESTQVLVPTDGGLPEVEIPSGSVSEELVGVWQQTRASSGDYTNQFGEDFSATSGFSAQLKITSDGKYYFAHYASGVSPSCALVSQFDESVGSAVLEGDTLTLTPVVRRIDVDNCTESGSFDVDLAPIVLTVSLTEDRQFYGGMRSYKLALEGYSIPLDMSSLFRQPSYTPVQPEVPTDFVAGDTPAYQEIQGLWVAAAGTDASFYNPTTDDFYLPELNGSSHQWLRFEGEDYEAAVALQNVNAEGVCKLDLIYYERGTATFSITGDVGGQGSHFVGHSTFVARDSRLIVNVRECEEDNGTARYDLPALTSYFRWIYLSPNNPPESFTWVCDFAESEWQSLLCNGGTAGFSRQK